VGQMREKYAFSERRACGVLRMAVASYRYESKRSDEPLRTKLVELARGRSRASGIGGCMCCFVEVENE